VRACAPEGEAELSSVLLPPSSTNVAWLLLWPLTLIEVDLLVRNPGVASDEV